MHNLIIVAMLNYFKCLTVYLMGGRIRSVITYDVDIVN